MILTSKSPECPCSQKWPRWARIDYIHHDEINIGRWWLPRYACRTVAAPSPNFFVVIVSNKFRCPQTIASLWKSFTFFLEKFHIFFEKFAILRMKYILCIFKIRWKYIGKHVFMYLKVIYSKYSWHVFEDISQSIKPGKWNLDWLCQVHSNLFLQRQQISKCKSFFIQKISVCKFYLPKSFSRIYLWKEINLQKMSKVSGKFFYKNTFSRLWNSSLLHWLGLSFLTSMHSNTESSQIISSILQNF